MSTRPRHKPRVIRVSVDLPAAEVEELDAAIDAMAVPPTRSSLLRVAIRRGLRGLLPSRHGGGNVIAIRD